MLGEKFACLEKLHYNELNRPIGYPPFASLAANNLGQIPAASETL